MALEFHLFNYGAYPDIPHADFLESSAYIDLPNRHFDPVRGHWYFESYFDSLVFGEKLGFDGIHTTTQMGGPIGMTPSANLAAAYLAGRTERIKIGTLGPILNTYQNPMRAAEDIAVLDQITGGRLILGLPMGHGQNYHAAATMNPSLARQRHWEAHDLMVKAFTDEGPFEWQGEHFHVPYANLWPKPLQRPYPEVWIPGAGSKVTLERCARHGYTYQALFSPRKALIRNVKLFRQLAEEEYGYTPGPDQVAVVMFIHVAETDKQALIEAEPHLMYLMQNLNRAPQYEAFPPGHFSKESLRGFMTKGGYRAKDIGQMTVEDVFDEGWGVIGSPATVEEKLHEMIEDLGAGKLIHVADFGAMPNWLMRKSLTLMAEQVIPKFREPGAKPIWDPDLRVAPTHAQYGAMRTEPEAVPEARLHGHGVVDVRTAHVEELRVPVRD